MNHRFGITEEGHVYRYEGMWNRWRLLGRLPSILGEPTPVGREVCGWWKALVASDEPCPILVLKNSKKEASDSAAPAASAAGVVMASPRQENVAFAIKANPVLNMSQLADTPPAASHFL